MNTYQYYYAIHQSDNMQKQNLHLQPSQQICKNPQIQVIPNINIYLKYQNHGCKVHINNFIKLQYLKQIIKQKFNINQNQQVLFINGQQAVTIGQFYNYNQKLLSMSNKQIVYVKSYKNILNKQDSNIQLKLKIFWPLNLCHSFKQSLPKLYKFSLDPNEKLNKLHDIILSNQYFQQIILLNDKQDRFQINFTQSGRILDCNKSFISNKLQINCEINCIISKNSIKMQNAIKYNKDLTRSNEQQNNEDQQQQQINKTNIIKNKQNQTNKIHNKQIIRQQIKNPQIKLFDDKLTNTQQKLNEQNSYIQNKCQQFQKLYRSILDPMNKNKKQHQINSKPYKLPPLYKKIQRRINTNPNLIISNTYNQVQQIYLNKYSSDFNQFNQNHKFQDYYNFNVNPYELSKQSFKKKNYIPQINLSIYQNHLFNKINISKSKQQLDRMIIKQQKIIKSQQNLYPESHILNNNNENQQNYNNDFIKNINQYTNNPFNVLNVRQKSYKSSSPLITHERKMANSQKVKINHELSKLFAYSTKQQINQNYNYNNNQNQKQDNQNYSNNNNKNHQITRNYSNQVEDFDKRLQVLEFSKRHTMKSGNRNSSLGIRGSINNNQTLEMTLKRNKISNRYSNQKMDNQG